jgi:hypothetical protein
MKPRIGLSCVAALALLGAVAAPAASRAESSSLCKSPAAKSHYTLAPGRVEAFRAAVRGYFQMQGRQLSESTDGERLTQFDPVDQGQFLAESGPGESYAEMVDLYPACDGRLPRSQKALWAGFDRHMRRLGFTPRFGL